MPETKPVLLIVEDDPDIAEMLTAYFQVHEYDVLTANWGEDALALSAKMLPDLVILDIRLPDIDGYEVAHRLRGSRRTRQVPILFLTERRNRSDRLQGLSLGGDDYITKPFDIQELRLRVRNALSRSSNGSLTNPVTGLPEGALVDEKLAECISLNGWSILLVSLKNLDSFRESYGFVASDDVLRAISLMLHNAIREAGSSSDFLGQYSDTEFILVTSTACLPALQERISARLEQSLDYFYPLKDRTRSNPGQPRLEISFIPFSNELDKVNDVRQLKNMLVQQSL